MKDILVPPLPPHSVSDGLPDYAGLLGAVAVEPGGSGAQADLPPTETTISKMGESMDNMTVSIQKICDGLQYGSGPISTGELGTELLAKTDEAIMSPAILVKVETADDGCGDGRFVDLVEQLVDGAVRTYERSLNRAKVFGGGLAMGVAARVGSGEALDENESVEDVYTS